MKKIQVLLSTYNGEGFLPEQLDSILKQTYNNMEIFIRDDGSTDNTISIIEQYKLEYPEKFRVIYGENVGVIQSFFLLLSHSDENADYFCFCDQDDVWFSDKIERAYKYLHKEDSQEPIMYFTSTKLTDGKLKPLRNWPSRPRKPPSFYNALIQNIAAGITITINKEARDLLIKKQVKTDQILMHDWWTYLCVSAFGKVYYDDTPSVFYRQHGNNVVGGENTFIEKARKKWSSFKKHRGDHLLYKQAKEFYRLFGKELEDSKKQQLNLFLLPRQNMLDRLRFLYRSKLYRQTIEEHILFKILILIGYV